MTRSFDPRSPTIAGRFSVRAAWRRVSAWSARIVAALRDPQPQSPEDYERELRERVFHPPHV